MSCISSEKYKLQVLLNQGFVIIAVCKIDVEFFCFESDFQAHGRPFVLTSALSSKQAARAGFSSAIRARIVAPGFFNRIHLFWRFAHPGPEPERAADGFGNLRPGSIGADQPRKPAVFVPWPAADDPGYLRSHIRLGLWRRYFLDSDVEVLVLAVVASCPVPTAVPVRYQRVHGGNRSVFQPRSFLQEINFFNQGFDGQGWPDLDNPDKCHLYRDLWRRGLPDKVFFL